MSFLKRTEGPLLQPGDDVPPGMQHTLTTMAARITATVREELYLKIGGTAAGRQLLDGELAAAIMRAFGCTCRVPPVAEGGTHHGDFTCPLHRSGETSEEIA